MMKHAQVTVRSREVTGEARRSREERILVMASRRSRTRRTLAATTAAIAASGLVAASAASLGSLGEDDLGATQNVVAACQSGDERSPIETLDDATIEAISLELAFVEEDLVYRGLAREPFFQNRFPKIYGTSRHSVKPVSVEEVGKLVELLVRRSH